MNSPLDENQQLDDARLSRVLASLPREVAPDGFTDAVLSRIAAEQVAAGRSLHSSTFLDLRSKAARLLFGPKQSYWSLLAASAAIALAIGLGWASSSPNSNDETSLAAADPAAATVDEASSADSSSSDTANTFRGQPVTTAPGPRRSIVPGRVRMQPSRQVMNPRAVELQTMRDDYSRLQRELMILQQLASEGSPMIELGSNGQVDLYIDLSEFLHSAPGSKPTTGSTSNPGDTSDPEQEKL